MALYKWKLLNGGGLMKMKRWFGFLWRDHDNYDNAINNLEHQLEAMWVDMQRVKADRDRLIKQKQEIIKSIESATGKMKGMGEPFGGPSFTGMKKADVDAAPSNWKVAFKGQKRSGAASGETMSYTLGDLATTGVQKWDIPRAGRNQMERGNNGNQKGNNGNQQRNN